MSVAIKKPAVSIIVPVYNTAEYLYRCMDSLVYQSFENIEIITVNNGSTDNSLEILKKYERDFPEKVKVISTPHAERIGRGRNIGIQHANADYIVFADSDDMMHPKAIERLYGEIIKGNYDFVYAPFVCIKNNKATILRSRRYSIFQINNEQALLDAEPSSWAKIFRADFLKKAGGFPETICFEDLAFFYRYVGLAKKIGYCKYPVYYYFWRTNSECHTLVNTRIAETIDAEKYGLDNCEPCVRTAVVLNIAQRIFSNMSMRWIYADRYLEHLNNLWGEISSNPLVYKNTKLFKQLALYYKYSQTQTDKNIYIDGFGMKQLPDEYINYLKEASFYDGEVNIYILNEKNCNIDVLPSIRKAYENKNYNYVAGYFALKKIYEFGGTYIGRNIVIDLPLNFNRHLNAYFAFEGMNSYNDQIFGGHSKQCVFKYILDAYSNDNYTKQSKLANYISDVLEFRFNIKAFARTNLYAYDISIFSPDICSIPVTSNTYDVTKLHFSHLSKIPYFFTKEELDDCWLSKESFEWLRSQSIKSSLGVSKINENDKRELINIKSSRSWKLIQRFKRKKNQGIWKLFYQIYLLICEKILRE